MAEPVMMVPVTELITVNPMASVDTVTWWCRLCRVSGSATRRPAAVAAAAGHLADEHRAVHRRAQRGKPPEAPSAGPRSVGGRRG